MHGLSDFFIFSAMKSRFLVILVSLSVITTLCTASDKSSSSSIILSPMTKATTDKKEEALSSGQMSK